MLANNLSPDPGGKILVYSTLKKRVVARFKMTWSAVCSGDDPDKDAADESLLRLLPEAERLLIQFGSFSKETLWWKSPLFTSHPHRKKNPSTRAPRSGAVLHPKRKKIVCDDEKNDTNTRFYSPDSTTSLKEAAEALCALRDQRTSNLSSSPRKSGRCTRRRHGTCP